MIRLGASKSALTATRCDLGRGVSMELRPLVSFEYRAAQAKASKILDQYFDGAEALEPFGIPPHALAGMDEADRDYQLAGLSQVLVAVFAAEIVVTGWDGIGDSDGNALPPSRQAFGLLFQDGEFLRQFEAQAYRLIYLDADEGE